MYYSTIAECENSKVALENFNFKDFADMQANFSKVVGLFLIINCGFKIELHSYFGTIELLLDSRYYAESIERHEIKDFNQIPVLMRNYIQKIHVLNQNHLPE